MKKDTIPTPPPHAPAQELSPGMIRVKARIIGIQKPHNNKDARLTLRIVKFLAMGRSAPVVTSGDTIKVKALSLPKEVKKDDLFVINLKYRHILAQYRDTTPSWIYIKSTKLKEADDAK